jgi:hypothetical protein
MKEHRKAGKEKQRLSAKGAVGFELNPYYEQLLELREKKPAAYKVMSAATRLALEAYLKAKEAASGSAEIRKAAA